MTLRKNVKPVDGQWPYGVVLPTEVRRLPRKGYLVDYNDCWIYEGFTDGDGYGIIAVKFPRETSQQAHRYFWERWIGPIPDRMELDHTCRVRACINPEHLEVVTHAENMDRAKRHWPKRTHCSRWHRFTQGSTYLKGSKRSCKICVLARTRVRRTGVDFMKAMRKVERLHGVKQDLRAVVGACLAGRRLAE